jgi:hypothetical protein
MAIYNFSHCLNVDPTRTDRPDLQRLIKDLNPILQDILTILQSRPDATADGELSAPNFSKIMFSKVG